MAQRAYRVLMRLAHGPARLWLGWRARREPAYAQGLAARWGRPNLSPQVQGAILIHASSVGEVQAARPLIEPLLEEGHAVVVSTQTPTGAAALHAWAAASVAHTFAPIDSPAAVRRWLDAVQPRLVILMERELWPEFLWQCRERAIPVALVNARLSAKSARLYQRLSALMGPVWPGLSWVGAADDASLARLRALGVRETHSALSGNLKFDQPVATQASGHAATSTWPDLSGRVVVVAGSTHEADETQLVPAWRRYATRHPQALLVLVPRHPQRFDAAAGALTDLGLAFVRRSQGTLPDTHTQVILGDTMGELPRWYAAARACFIGGTFADVGGHNPLEALTLGCPITFGPLTRNFEAVYADVEACGAGVRVADGAQWERTLDAWQLPAASPEHDRAAAAARSYVAQHRGAARRTRESLAALDPAYDPQRRTRVDSRLVEGQTIWHDPALMEPPGPSWFEGEQEGEHGPRQALSTGSGRGVAHRVTLPSRLPVLLRHYRRGGWVATFTDDRFAREPAVRSRALREYALLRLMHAWGLPTPRPVAARFVPRGLSYTADIAVAWIDGAVNLVDRLERAPLPAVMWQAVGRAIAQLHAQQVFHSDLNAHNIVIDALDAVWIVDFDKCELRPGGAWKVGNLERLQRSLRKEQGRRPALHWTNEDREALLQGYAMRHERKPKAALTAT
jgi:3-deoxy-D-manno-octulosonic-acid transferase